MRNKILRTAVLLAATIISGGCAPEQPEDEVTAVAPVTVDTKQAAMPRSPAPEGAVVYFLTPQDGAVVSSPVRVEFGITGMALVPAGRHADNSGHHHVLIDADLPDLSLPIPADEKHVHFGDGSATAELELEPGEHTLQLLFADYLHIPHDAPVYSERITITVE
jgi:hypothetical protein